MDDEATRWSTAGRVAAVVIVVGIVAMWVYIFSRTGREHPLDQLGDPAYAEEAQARCEAAIQPLEDAPPAGTPPARADQLEEANRRLRALVDELERLAPERGQDAGLVGEWLDDWDTYLGDREEYVDALRRDGEDAEFLVTPRGGRQITLTMEHFADINDMPDCAPPGDV
jgi:hypothetical protein